MRCIALVFCLISPQNNDAKIVQLITYFISSLPNRYGTILLYRRSEPFLRQDAKSSPIFLELYVVLFQPPVQ